MKRVAPKIVLVFKDLDGFGAAIADSLHPLPNSSFRRLEESFELSLERYGIKDCKASGNLVHFVDDMGNYEVSLLLLETYEPPILVCAINEALTQVIREATSDLPTFIVPFIGSSSKLKFESKALATDGSQVSVYGVQIGPETDVTQAIASRTQKPPSSLQICYEPLACFIQLARVLKLPTSVLIGQKDWRFSNKTSGEELEILNEIGEIVANTTRLCFLKDKIRWNPARTSRDTKEPWRALYG